MREEETAKKLRKSACLHTGRESKDECTGKVSIKMNLFSSLCGCVPGVITHTHTCRLRCVDLGTWFPPASEPENHLCSVQHVET